MTMEQKVLGLASEKCLDALAIAFPVCKDQLNDEDVKALKLTCKELKGIIDVLLRYLLVDGSNKDFEVILRPTLLENLRTLHISFENPEFAAELKDSAEEIRQLLKLTAHNLHEFDVFHLPASLAELVKGLWWPNLQRLSLNIGSGELAKVKEELFSMRQLRFLDLKYQEELSNHDGEVLLAAPFLSNLKDLSLNLTSVGVGMLSPKYISGVLTKATSLEKLELHGDLSFDYFGSAKLEHATRIEFNNEFDDESHVHFGPLLAQPRPSLRVLTVKGGVSSTKELETLLSTAKQTLPNLISLSITGLETAEDDVDAVWDDEPDWNCLKRIDLPNLFDLEIECHLKDLVGIVQPTANLPRIKILEVQGCTAGYPRNFALETMQHTEQMFSSPLVLQLRILKIKSEYFRLDSLAILCKYAPQFKDLEHLTVHSRDLEGVRMLADAGKKGGFPNLKIINLYAMDGSYSYVDFARNKLVGKPYYLKQVRDCLKTGWQNIVCECSFRDRMFDQYDMPDEFAGPDFDEPDF